MMQLFLTETARADLAEIHRFTRKTWGKKQADSYIRDINDALILLQENPGILKHEKPFAGTLMFYRVKSHYLIFDRFGDSLYLLTVKQTSMDIPARLSELEESLILEAKMLHKKITSTQ